MGERLTDIFMQLFCEKNSDGSKNLRLKGKDLYQRIGQRLDSEDMHTVAEFLQSHEEIVSLNLCYNDIGDDGLQVLCDEFLRWPNNLEHLNVIQCDVTSSSVKKMAQLRNTLRLKTIRLCGNKLGPDNGVVIAILLEACPTIQYLDIGDCDLTVEGVETILLKIMWMDIKVLNLSRVIPKSCIYQYDPKDIAEYLSQVFRMNSSLVELHAQKCRFDGHDVEILIEGLKYNQSLLFLDLGYNKIGDFGTELLFDWIKTRPKLLGLNIAGNFVRNHGATSIGLCMPFSKLRLLDISYNEIDENGMCEILDSIKKPYMLRFFYMWGNTLKHRANTKIKRMVLSTVFVQERIDVKIYRVDGVLYAARYPADKYKHRYYEVMDHGCPIPLKIIKNKVEEEGATPRGMVKFKHVERFPDLYGPNVWGNL